MEFLTVQQTAALLQWSSGEVLAALNKGILVGIKVPDRRSEPRKFRWAVVHPGAMFVDYLRNPESRLPYITILTVKDVAAILGINGRTVRRYIERGYIKPNVFRGTHGKAHNEHLFAPMQVRSLLLRLSKRDPRQRPRIPEEIMKKFFEKSMIPKVSVDPLEWINEELEWICRTPEPERSLELAKLMRQAEEIYKQQQEELSRGNGTNASMQCDQPHQETHSGV